MKKKTRSKKDATPQVDPYLEGLMGKLLDRLVSLETKVDTLIAQGGSAKPYGSAHPPKPFQNPAPPQPSSQPRRDRTLYEAVCADCHKVCEVPFKPSEDRAVYCKECFAKRKSKSSFPVLTPVAMPNKLFSKPPAPQQPAPPSAPADQKKKKASPAKKTKKKK